MQRLTLDALMKILRAGFFVIMGIRIHAFSIGSFTNPGEVQGSRISASIQSINTDGVFISCPLTDKNKISSIGYRSNEHSSFLRPSYTAAKVREDSVDCRYYTDENNSSFTIQFPVPTGTTCTAKNTRDNIGFNCK